MDRPINSWTRFVSHVFWAIGTFRTILTLPTFPFLSDFDYVANPRYGRCLQFPKAKSLTSSTRFTGPRFGLQVVLNLDVDQYTFASNVGKGLVDQYTFASNLGKGLVDQYTFASNLGEVLVDQHTFASSVGKGLVDQYTFASSVGKT